MRTNELAGIQCSSFVEEDVVRGLGSFVVVPM
jgi:hypothetical protein